MPNNEGLLSVSEAWQYCRDMDQPVSTQSIYKALADGRLKAAREKPWMIRVEDLNDWLGRRRPG